jgi:hypothetical protein
MKLLPGENLPHQLRHELPGHDFYTVAFMDWAGIESGELLRRAAAGGFDGLVTKNAGVQYEQNLANLPLAVVILHVPSNDIDDVRSLIPALLQALTALLPKSITHVP